jgi:hypothetical protein
MQQTILTNLTTKPIRTLILEIVKEGIATHTSEIVFNVQSIRKNIKEHSVRARLSEAVLKKNLIRLQPGVYDIYREEQINSVVDYPDRGPWGDNQYRGNFSGYLVRDLYYQLRPKSVLDIFAGSGTSGDFFSGLRNAKQIEVSYTGLDLKNGFDVLTDPIEGQYDLILAHFPYFNIITYSRHTSDLSNTDDYSHFLSNVRMVMEKIHSALTEDGTIAVVIGDVRKQGKYYPIFNDIINMNTGVLRSVIIKKQNHCHSTGRSYRRSKYLIPIAHEYVLLFSKQ